MEKLKLTMLSFMLISSVYSANCPSNWQQCWTGDYRFDSWVGAWEGAGSWSPWQSMVPFSVPSPIAGKDDTAYDAMSYQYHTIRSEERSGKDQWEYQNCRNTASTEDEPEYYTYWSIVLPAKYTRTATKLRSIIMITVTDCADPDNIHVIDTYEFSDTTTPSFGFKSFESHDEPATIQCAE